MLKYLNRWSGCQSRGSRGTAQLKIWVIFQKGNAFSLQLQSERKINSKFYEMCAGNVAARFDGWCIGHACSMHVKHSRVQKCKQCHCRFWFTVYHAHEVCCTKNDPQPKLATEQHPRANNKKLAREKNAIYVYSRTFNLLVAAFFFLFLVK